MIQLTQKISLIIYAFQSPKIVPWSHNLFEVLYEFSCTWLWPLDIGSYIVSTKLYLVTIFLWKFSTRINLQASVLLRYLPCTVWLSVYDSNCSAFFFLILCLHLFHPLAIYMVSLMCLFSSCDGFLANNDSMDKKSVSYCLVISSFWQLFAVLLPIVGIGAFMWWAGRDIVQSSVSNLNSDLYILVHVCFLKFHKTITSFWNWNGSGFHVQWWKLIELLTTFSNCGNKVGMAIETKHSITKDGLLWGLSVPLISRY